MTAATATEESLYLVWPAEDDLPCEASRLVCAPDEDTAVTKYIENVLARDDDWLEEVYTNSAQMRFARHFYIEKGVPLWDDQGDWVCSPEEARQIFETNVRDFFGFHEDWADLYLRFFGENRTQPWQSAMAEWRFPQEMIGYMLRTLGGGWCEIARIPLDEIQRIA
jgi:hypothetical protein